MGPSLHSLSSATTQDTHRSYTRTCLDVQIVERPFAELTRPNNTGVIATMSADKQPEVEGRSYFSVSNAKKGERKVLLVANGTMKGDKFLAHCIDALIGHYKGISKLCFIPCGEADWGSYTNKVRGVFAPYG